MQGKLIVIEGSDGSGKNTQASLLKNSLILSGIKSELLSFPQYHTLLGGLTAKYLHGEFGKLEDVLPEIPILLYAVDRYQAVPYITQGIKNGHWFVLDRYRQSNLVHQGAKYHGKARENLIQFIKDVERREPEEDLVIYIQMDADISQKLIDERAERDITRTKDIHESKIEYLRECVKLYSELADSEGWSKVPGTSKSEILPREVVHNSICELVEREFNINLIRAEVN